MRKITITLARNHACTPLSLSLLLDSGSEFCIPWTIGVLMLAWSAVSLDDTDVDEEFSNVGEGEEEVLELSGWGAAKKQLLTQLT